MTDGTNQPTMNTRKEPKKVFGVEARSLAAVLGLTLFFVLAMAGVVISLRQRFVKESVAPNAPESRPSAAKQQKSECTLSFTVASVVTSPSPSPSTSPSPSPSVSPSPSPSVSPSPSPSGSPNPSASPSPTTVASVSPSPTTPGTPSSPAPGCNDTCATNGDCSNSNHICFNSQCRLADNPNDTSCAPAQTIASQPELPEELPQSGSEDVANWLKAGLGVLGIGAILLLLL